MKKVVIIILLLTGWLAISQNSVTLPIPDFTCGYQGNMIFGFKNGKPICSAPAGFIEPDLKCDQSSYWPKVLVGIKDGQAVCKEIEIQGDDSIDTTLWQSDSRIYIHLHYVLLPATNQP